MKIISKRALNGDEMAPAKALQQEGLWHVVGTERAHAKGTEQARGAWETGHQKRYQGARSHHTFRLW